MTMSSSVKAGAGRRVVSGAFAGQDDVVSSSLTSSRACTGSAMPNGAGLAGLATASDATRVSPVAPKGSEEVPTPATWSGGASVNSESERTDRRGVQRQLAGGR